MVKELLKRASDILNRPAKTYMTMLVPIGAAIDIQRSSYATSEGFVDP